MLLDSPSLNAAACQRQCVQPELSQHRTGEAVQSPPPSTISPAQAQSWSYLFTRHTPALKIAEKLREKFPTFVHRSIVYKRVGKRIIKRERDTISGLVFVNGAAADIQQHLRDNFPDLHLAYDSASGEPAVIADAEMRAFMRISSAEGRSVRFMLHPIDDYAKGRQRVSILSGPLEGLEGYVVRLGRDRCLVTAIGNFTVAIGGVHKDPITEI